MNEKQFLQCDNCGAKLKVYIADEGHHWCSQNCRELHEAAGCPSRQNQIFEATPARQTELNFQT